MSEASVPRTRVSASENKWDNPFLLVGLWLLATILHVVGQLVFPEFVSMPFASSFLYLSATPVFAALVASVVAGPPQRPFRLASALLAVDIAAVVLRMVLGLFVASSMLAWLGPAIAFAVFVASLTMAIQIMEFHGPRWRLRRAVAVFAAAFIVAAAPFARKLDAPLYELSMQVTQQGDDSEGDLPPSIDAERLWTSQPALVAHSLSVIQPATLGSRGAYVIAVAADGSQRIFGREARFAQLILGREFGAEQRRVLLSNDRDHLFRVPVAANSNLDALLSGLAQKMDARRDLMVIYLASHGNARAELATDLPDYSGVQPIGGSLLRQELDRAGIKRRVIIVSACHAGSWIKPLATDDTIVIAAARADRSSFGCDDSRELTYFGEAFLKADVSPDASLADRFDAAKRKVATWESEILQPHSEPQAFIGKNMSGVWKSPAPTAATR